jgi:hypothetical protein
VLSLVILGAAAAAGTATFPVEVIVGALALLGVLGTAMIAGPLMWILNRLAVKTEAHSVAATTAVDAASQAASSTAATLSEVRTTLTKIETAVAAQGTLLDQHIAWHAHTTPVAPIVRLRRPAAEKEVQQ